MMIPFRRPLAWSRGAARAIVRRALDDYRIDFTLPEPNKPTRLAAARSVLVVGGGLAGISAAEVLARRGFRVTLRERSAEIGGKIGGSMARDADGREAWMDHGFHAFFHHYDNLRKLLDRAGVPPMRTIDDYVIAEAGGALSAFGAVEPTPLLNVLDLWRRGFFRFGEVSSRRTRELMHELLQYDDVRTFRELDHMSFADYARAADLPPRLRRIFATFARAFFAEDHRLSAAELVRAFHFYYLGHDEGLIYDYPEADSRTALVEPLTRHLERLGVAVETGRSVDRVDLDDERVVVDGVAFDAIVLAAPALAVRDLVSASPTLRAALPRTGERLERLERGARYAVLRGWLDRDPCPRWPVFVSTDRVRLLDAVASIHRVVERDAAWARRTGGAVLELHSYAVPDDVPDAEVTTRLVEELARFAPEAAAARWLHVELQLRDDFAARHVGMAAHRPATRTEHPAVLLAGDWVALPTPALLMEGACTSGLLAANALLEAQGLASEHVTSVPLRGVFAPERRRAS